MKKHISMILILTLVFTMFFGSVGVARAAGVDVKITGTTELAAAGTTSLTVTVTNTTGVEIAEGSTLRNSDGTKTYGDSFPKILGDGSPVSDTFSFEVTEDMFGNSKTFQLYDVSGIAISGATTTVTFTKKMLSVAMAATFSVSPSNLVASGDIVTFKFVIENQGEAPISDISIVVPGVNGNKPLNSTKFSVAPGKSKTYEEFQYKVTTAATLAPVISYTANGTPGTYNPAPVDLTIELRDVSVTFTVDNSAPNAGQQVTFTADVTNNGNVTYSSVTAYINGEKVDFPANKLAPGAQYSEAYPMSFVASTDVTFMLTMVDHKGETVNVEKTVTIALPIDNDAITSKLTMTVEVDRPSLTSAGTVTFTGNITNATDYTLTNLVVMETAQNKEAYNNALISSYGTASFEYEAQVSETTTFNFVLTVADTEGVTHTTNPVPVEVKISSAPVGTDFENAADVTPSGEAETGNNSGWGVVPIIAIILVVLIIGVGVALLVLWKQQKFGGAPSGKSSGLPGKSGGSSGKSGSSGKTGGANRRPITSSAKRKPVSRGYRDRNSF